MKNGCFITLLVLALVSAISWAITVGIIKLITICFGLNFSLLIATGIWLAMILAKTVFSSNSSSK